MLSLFKEFITIFLLLCGFLVVETVEAKGRLLPNQYIVRVIEDENPQHVANEIAARHNGFVLGTFEHAIRGFVIHLPVDKLPEVAFNNLGVLTYEPDQIITIDKKPSGRLGGGGGGSEEPAPPQETPWGVARVGYGNGEGRVAWILDTGVDLDHPDLNVDTRRSVSFLGGNRRNRTPDDGHGHGTHVAGTIGAIDNGQGVVGVAAGATIVAVRVLDSSGSGTLSGVIAGIDYVAANAQPGDVANMSLSGAASSALDDAVFNASQRGVYFVVAAGNSAAHSANYSPARQNGAYILTVSAMGQGDVWASFSNYANPPIDYCAPGVDIKSTWKGGGYHTISGTSMAAPHVAGLLLLGNGIKIDGYVLGDPDGNPDPIPHSQP